jgi:hypothetical protein
MAALLKKHVAPPLGAGAKKLKENQLTRRPNRVNGCQVNVGLNNLLLLGNALLLRSVAVGV